MPDLPESAAAARIGDDPALDQTPDSPEPAEISLLAHCAASGLEPEWLQLLCDVCLNIPAADPLPVLRAMRAVGIEPVTIAEGYIPAAARILGESWCADRSDFVRVTVGCSRLHRILREISDDWRGPELIDPLAIPLLVVVEDGTYHTLGATVLSGSLRRKGFAVRLMVGAQPKDFVAELRDSDYAAVLISASGRGSLEAVRRLVSIAHDAAMGAIPVVVGGPITKDGETTTEEVLSMTGADHCTDDPDEALELCGLAEWQLAQPEPTTASRRRA
jgi:MerR family transcriptional regulator, light-induced transcriptional regulator